jgi:hypothetical protein
VPDGGSAPISFPFSAAMASTVPKCIQVISPMLVTTPICGLTTGEVLRVDPVSVLGRSNLLDTEGVPRSDAQKRSDDLHGKIDSVVASLASESAGEYCCDELFRGRFSAAAGHTDEDDAAQYRASIERSHIDDDLGVASHAYGESRPQASYANRVENCAIQTEQTAPAKT